jgi:hypothetical protein
MSRLVAFARRLGPAAREIRVNPAPHDSKTDRTDQTDQHIENYGRFAALPGRKLTTPSWKLTGRPDHGGLPRSSVP